MNRTKIEWVKNPDGTQGYTWNPITGCFNHVNGLCNGGGFPCYVYKLAHGRLKEKYLENRNLAPNAKGGVMKLSIAGRATTEREGDWADPFYPRFWEGRLDDSLFITKSLRIRLQPRGIFVCDMGELFGNWIPREWQEEIFLTIVNNPQHRFYLLTKQPQNLIKFSPFPENCWVGVTATNADMCIRGGYCLTKIDAQVKFLSLEPLLDWQHGKPGFIATMLNSWGVNWLIIGQQTPISAKTQPKIEWIKEIVEAADKAGVKVFLKDNLRPLLVPEDCRKPNYLMDDMFWASEQAKLRQELPE